MTDGSRSRRRSASGPSSGFTSRSPARPSPRFQSRTPGISRRPGKGTILFVEDETNVREFAAAVLQQDGYTLLQAKSAENALEVWRWHSGRINLLLTDVVLPGELSGLQLGEKLQQEKPELRVVLSTGYSRENIAPSAKDGKSVFVLSKPYTPRSLLQAVHEVMA